MFTISVCMIIKNEQSTLKRVLACAKKFADEIIIVDTGSTDNSKQIASTFTDKVFDFVWVNDFSKARNFAFSKAQCDYQMWLDADDVIEQEDINKILALKNSNKNADVFMFKYIFGSLTYFRERLLKRSKNFKWQGFVHEVIAPSGKIEYCDIKIIHKKEKHGDPKRNLKLYQQALKRNVKFSARELYYYSRELFYNGYYTKAITNFKRYLKLPNSYPPDNLGAHLMLAECYKEKKLPQNELNILFEGLKKHIPTAELCCKIGYAFERLNDLQKAIFYFESALHSPPSTTGFVQKDYEDIIPYLELTKLYFNLKEFEKAKYYHIQAKACSPAHPSVIYNERFFS